MSDGHPIEVPLMWEPGEAGWGGGGGNGEEEVEGESWRIVHATCGGRHSLVLASKKVVPINLEGGEERNSGRGMEEEVGVVLEDTKEETSDFVEELGTGEEGGAVGGEVGKTVEKEGSGVGSKRDIPLENTCSEGQLERGKEGRRKEERVEEVGWEYHRKKRMSSSDVSEEEVRDVRIFSGLQFDSSSGSEGERVPKVAEYWTPKGGEEKVGGVRGFVEAVDGLEGRRQLKRLNVHGQ